jgi:hypothetical protein
MIGDIYSQHIRQTSWRGLASWMRQCHHILVRDPQEEESYQFKISYYIEFIQETANVVSFGGESQLPTHHRCPEFHHHNIFRWPLIHPRGAHFLGYLFPSAHIIPLSPLLFRESCPRVLLRMCCLSVENPKLRNPSTNPNM